jgi:adenylate kinase family enzyme
VHLSTGDLLREEVKKGGELAERLEEIMKQGKLVSSALLVELLKKTMKERGWENKKFLLDGFPRNLENVYEWNRQIGEEAHIDFILYLEVDYKTMLDRLLKRALTSGRADDNEATIKKRFETFEKETLPVIREFEKQNKVKKINSSGHKNETYEKVKELLV